MYSARCGNKMASRITVTFVDKNHPQDKAGRPPHKSTPKDRRAVEILSGFGSPQRQIAHVAGVGLMTLRKHYRDELDAGAARSRRS